MSSATKAEKDQKEVELEIRQIKLRDKTDVTSAIENSNTLMEIKILVEMKLKRLFHVDHDSSVFPYPLFKKAIDKWINLTSISIKEAKSVGELDYARKWGFFYTDGNWYEEFNGRIQDKLNELADSLASSMTSCLEGHEFLKACDESILSIIPTVENVIAKAMVECEKSRMSCDENARQLFEVLVSRFSTLHLSKGVLEEWREIVQKRLDECKDEKQNQDLKKTLEEIEGNKSRTKLSIKALDAQIDSDE